MRAQADMIDAVHLAVGSTHSEKSARALGRYVKSLRNPKPGAPISGPGGAKAASEEQARRLLEKFRKDGLKKPKPLPKAKA